MLWVSLLWGAASLRVNGQGEARTEACKVLVVVDQTVYGPYFNSSKTVMVQTVGRYINGLNNIYVNTILKHPPYEEIYFQLGEVRVVDNFMVGCENKGVILSEFTKIANSADFCLAHLLTYRDFGCVIGLATIGGLCRNYGNTGWTKMDPDESYVINTMAHEIGHNFGSDHDGQDHIQYRSCNGSREGIMSGGRHQNFSTCSLSAMHARLQEILGAEEKDEGGDSCFDTKPKPEASVTSEDLSSHQAACPTLPPDDCQGRPDPPEIPEPPPEPECGDLEVQDPLEECDCGKDYLECEDPCCYPAVISQYDLDLNKTAKPCHRNQKEVCITPYQAPLKFGLLFPLLFILLLVLLLAIILWLDWRFGKRRLYFHITEREERRNAPVHVETEEQMSRRLAREQEKARLRA